MCIRDSPLTAADPSPRNQLLVAPIKVDFSSERFGPVATRMVEKPPMISVVHKRRNISTGKEVFPGGKPGQYEIMLMFHNSSDSALDDLALHDIVPGTFTIEESIVRSDNEGERDAFMTKESARDGTQVTWAIGRIMQGERIEVLYTIQGDPEAEYKVSDAQDFHGATFGDEVDEEPNLPEWVDESTRMNLEIPNVDPQLELDLGPQTEENGEEDVDSNSDVDVDLSTPQVQNVEPMFDESEEAIEDSDDSEEESHQATIVAPDVCPVCGTEAPVGASSCETCSFQFG